MDQDEKYKWISDINAGGCEGYREEKITGGAKCCSIYARWISNALRNSQTEEMRCLDLLEKTEI